MVYALGNRGADFLNETLGIPRAKVDWASKNHEVKNLYMEHTLMVNIFLTALKIACARREDIEFIEQERIIKNEPVLKLNITRDFKGKVQNLRYNLVPDAVFGLRFLNEDPNRNRSFYLLEADRSTMPIVRTNIYKTSFFKKMIGYKYCKIRGVLKQVFGFEYLRILTITISEQRAENILTCCRSMYEKGNESGMFLFSLARYFTLDNIDNVFKPLWRNARDDRLIGLLD